MKIAIAFACGLVFALGLGISGMTLPERVLGFLDIFGQWDPTLMFMMVPAMGFYFAGWHVFRGRRSPFGAPIPGKAAHHFDARLFSGAAIFGVGWGMAGICPGPALTNLTSAQGFVYAFIAAMLAGIVLSQAVTQRATTAGARAKPKQQPAA
jgi:uncharacterized protein